MEPQWAIAWDENFDRCFLFDENGRIPWLLVIEKMSQTGRSLSSLIDKQIQAYPYSGEINFRVKNAQEVIKRVIDKYEIFDSTIDHTDGISLEFQNWHFNLRSSNEAQIKKLSDVHHVPQLVVIPLLCFKLNPY